ncbi:MAG: 23S rRNA (adenine(2503)-C(2))-methyltransferase RlmN [Desulfobacterales bacterium]|nr:23S rRNA (adenine(2503)-C(2))-methyltransferase RlmN [Desulfobacterales bacterium]
MDTMVDLRNLTRSQMTGFVAELGLPAARGDRLFASLQRPGRHDLARMVEINKETRALLAGHAMISRLTPEVREQSQDGTRKYGFRLHDGAFIESVLIPEGDRHTLCISSQAGCAMGCDFCLTGTRGFIRNLQPAEMVNQVLGVMEEMIGSGIKRDTPRELINNLVFMGMGEPLANYNNLVTALRILMDEKGLEFTERRVTVSTCGIVPRIRELGRDVKVNLAVSLHAADDAVRSRLMPINKTYGVDELLAACRDYPLSKNKVILIEYILLKGINDSLADAGLLAEKLREIPCRINLLPCNRSPDMDYQCSDEKRIKEFQGILRNAGYRTLIRNSRGADISAACGQLAGRKM